MRATSCEEKKEEEERRCKKSDARCEKLERVRGMTKGKRGNGKVVKWKGEMAKWRTGAERIIRRFHRLRRWLGRGTKNEERPVTSTSTFTLTWT